MWLDATYLKQREGGRVVSVAAIIAVAVNTEGRREIVGLHIGPSEAEPFWSFFLKGLLRRGLGGVKLVISDAHDLSFWHKPSLLQKMQKARLGIQLLWISLSFCLENYLQ